MDQMSSFGPEFKIESIRLGYFTIVNTQTGGYRTFRIRRQDDSSPFCPGKHIVGLLNGPDNEGHYKSFAFIDDEGANAWRRLSATGPEWGQYSRALFSLIKEGELSPYYAKGYKIKHSEKCFICGRTLTSPESIETGIGPICAGR